MDNLHFCRSSEDTSVICYKRGSSVPSPPVSTSEGISLFFLSSFHWQRMLRVKVPRAQQKSRRWSSGCVITSQHDNTASLLYLTLIKHTVD